MGCDDYCSDHPCCRADIHSPHADDCPQYGLRAWSVEYMVRAPHTSSTWPTIVVEKWETNRLGERRFIEAHTYPAVGKGDDPFGHREAL
jgi:hypothetical protein